MENAHRHSTTFGGDPAGADSFFHWGVKDAVDLHDIVVKQAPDLDHGAGRIWRLAPNLCLRLVHHGCKPVQVTHVDGEPHAILQAGALRSSNQPDIEECLTNAGLGVLHQLVGRRIDALHTGDKDEVTGSSAEAPGTLRPDGPGRIECSDTVRRRRLRKAETRCHGDCRHARKSKSLRHLGAPSRMMMRRHRLTGWTSVSAPSPRASSIDD